MNLLSILLHLFVVLFNKLAPEKKKIFFEVGTGYQIEMNVTSMKVKKNNPPIENDCALIPLDKMPKHDLI